MTTTFIPALPEGKDTTKKIWVIGHIDSIRWKTKKRMKNLFSPDLLIKKNWLSLAPNGNSFLCKELYEVEAKFDKLHSAPEKLKELESDIDDFIKTISKDAKLRKTSKEDETADEVRLAGWKEIFDNEVTKLKSATKEFTPLKKLLFWLWDYWWYYNTEFREKINVSFPDKDFVNSVAKKYLVEALPSSVKETVNDMRVVNMAVWHGHFAILFDDKENELRRIVTDSQLFELRWVYGYSYIDITPEWKPIARSVCNQWGGRCFFDGEKLMAHRKFQTCAPKTTIIDWGYKVNSTNCTIVNGKLCSLIDADDSVAHTTWAGFMGMLDFSTQEALASYKMNEESATKMKVREWEITLNGEKIKPAGIFSPSHTKLLENGFTLFEFSEFHEIDNYIYNKVTVIDDRIDFIKSAEEGLKWVERLSTLATGSKKEALEHILETDPDAALLDMHLTQWEEFEWLWIANELQKRWFKWEIMIISWYWKDKLKAMRALIKKDKVHIPGKDLREIDKCLYGKCDCL
ncbi:MAG: hypothetical protein ACD_3C00136G0002 [uncultured bacterium (gcode 4)]|uniref:Uncharacterized protein n=1 Tax=uncultured bacterium (gcode 4) TaxID=1234023 RepID=K2F9S8_9BACT|nr:MAG: hypothetical protein ACD_3C00136G0002 [uncultured bacterium (gcode 4)]